MKVLFLAHRIPFPPDKGDKIRAFHFLDHLAASHQVWLGAAADDPADMQHVGALRALCADVCIAPLGPVRRARICATSLAVKASATGAST